MILDESAPIEPGDHLATAVRAHVAELNRRFLNIDAGLANIDASMRDIISEHLDSIGLDDIRPQHIQS